MSGWNKSRKKIWGLSEPFLGMGVALLPEHLVKNSGFVLPEHLVCSPITWPRWQVEGSHDLVVQQKLDSLDLFPNFLIFTCSRSLLFSVVS